MRKGALLKAVEEAVRTHENYTKVEACDCSETVYLECGWP